MIAPVPSNDNSTSCHPNASNPFVTQPPFRPIFSSKACQVVMVRATQKTRPLWRRTSAALKSPRWT
jgi:hypothetical protein